MELATAPGGAASRDPGEATPERSRRRRPPVASVLIAAVFLTGVAVLLYPAASGWLSQYRQSQVLDGYTVVTEGIGPEGRVRALAEARAYNAGLTGGTVDVEAFASLPATAEAGAAGRGYDELLAADDRGLMARLRIPAIDVDLPIYHGTGDETLRKGVGHLRGSALPVGGIDTHSVLTAHRGLAESVLFSHLDRLEIGDEFTIEVFGEVLAYRVVTTRVIAPEQTETLRPRRGSDMVTLVTCTPLGINSHRILVTGERIDPTPPEHLGAAGQSPVVPYFPWWGPVFGAALLIAGGYVWWSCPTPGLPSRRLP